MTTSYDRREFLRAAAGGAALAAAGAVPGLSFAQAKGLTLAEIKKAGELKIGCEAAYVPFTFRREGKIVGYDVDMAELFCKTLGVKANFIDTAWAGVIPSLYAKKFDIIMSSMSYTPERLKRVAFTIPYAEASQALLVRAADAGKIKSLEDLSNRVVAVKLGSVAGTIHPKLDEQVKKARGQGFKEVRTFDDHPAAYISLAQGRVDGVLNNLPPLAMVLKDQPGKYALVRGVGADNWAGIALRQEDTEVLAFLNKEIARIKKDGSLYKLQDKWFGFRHQLADAVPTT
jgi:polar amino acid transport system substrate-binding protein